MLSYRMAILSRSVGIKLIRLLRKSRRSSFIVFQLLSYRSTIESTETYNSSRIPQRFDVSADLEAQELLDPIIFNPDFAPLMRENLANLPKTLVVTCEYDTLRDEGMIYAERLKAAGVPTTFTNYKHGFHAMLNMHNEIAEASNCLHDIIHWISKLF